MNSTKRKRPKNIVIAEDDITIHIVFDKILKNLGYNPSFASNVEDAILLVNENSPHLIIIDVFLGDQDGFDIVKQLKQTQKYKDIPIMMMSSTMTKQVLLKSIELGASDNIAKPIQNKVLIQKIRKILKDNQLPSVDMTKLKDKNTTTDLKCHGDLIRINEVSCILKSPIKFKENKHPVLESNFLDFLGASKCKVRSVRTSAVAEPGEYNTELTFLGMDEKTSTKIRKIKITP